MLAEAKPVAFSEQDQEWWWIEKICCLFRWRFRFRDPCLVAMAATDLQWCFHGVQLKAWHLDCRVWPQTWVQIQMQLARMDLSSWIAEGSECFLQCSNVWHIFLALDVWILAVKEMHHLEMLDLGAKEIKWEVPELEQKAWCFHPWISLPAMVPHICKFTYD